MFRIQWRRLYHGLIIEVTWRSVPAPKIEAHEAAVGRRGWPHYCMPEQSKTTQKKDISQLTVNNTRSFSAQNRTHLLNNPKHIQASVNANQTAMDQSKLHFIFCCTNAVWAISDPLLSVNLMPWHVSCCLLTITRGARPTKSLWVV